MSAEVKIQHSVEPPQQTFCRLDVVICDCNYGCKFLFLFCYYFVTVQTFCVAAHISLHYGVSQRVNEVVVQHLLKELLCLLKIPSTHHIEFKVLFKGS